MLKINYCYSLNRKGIVRKFTEKERMEEMPLFQLLKEAENK